ncbi:MAG: hydantoinase/oxoprolinase family protein, partial [Actinobacteria bacterium]|nr:hydantoinase/oxoprolinase family protein [Actinomycetota bacterium]
MRPIIGVDIGGTFTDCIVVTPDGAVTIGKALSTGPEFDDGFINAVAAAAARLGLDLEELVSSAEGIYHGCTVGTNAMVEGRTAKVALLTTRGHRDVLASMQAGRRLRSQTPEYIAHVSVQTKPDPLVPRSLIFEVDERVGLDGEVIVQLNEERAIQGIRELRDKGAEAFSVSLLWSVANDAHERRIAELIEQEAPGLFVSRASAVVNRIGEYERTVATVVNSLIGPAMDSYLERVQERLRGLGYERTLQIMTCSGGV